MSVGYTPYLHLALNGSAEENRNSAILDAKALDLARNLIANIPAGGDLTGFYPDPLIRDGAVTPPKLLVTNVPNPGLLLSTDASGNFIWVAPPATQAAL